MHEKIIILDFGGQYAHLIASRIRREGVLAEIYNPDEVDVDFFQDKKIKGLILSGGPQSVYDETSPKCDSKIFNLGFPVLGICYGHQFLCHSLGGEVTAGKVKEYGRAELTQSNNCPLFKNIPETSTFWMSHGDEVTSLPKGFSICGSTDDCQNASLWNKEKNIFGIQFHPEVTHSTYGSTVLSNFLDICKVQKDWTIEKFLEEESTKLKEQIGDRNVFLFVSGGVDSTVAFSFLSKILGQSRVKGLFVDTGLLRKNEVTFVEKALREIGADLTVLREANYFLEELKNISDPETKRERIGHAFLDVQQKFFAKNKIGEDWLLAQGTIYPDTIETGGTKNSAKIKTHHNRAPEVQKLIDAGKIIEPLKELYKDEVRELGELLGLPQELVHRHPFPGPGLGVRILCSSENIEKIPNDEISAFTLQKDKKPFLVLPIKSVGVQGDGRTYRHPAILKKNDNILSNGNLDLEKAENFSTKLINHYSEINRCLVQLGQNFEGSIKKINIIKSFVTKDRVNVLQIADDIVTQNLEKMSVYSNVWQFPVVLVPISFNNGGTESVILRPIDSIDAMSASVGKLPLEFFEKVTTEILKDKTISAVFLDITSKPPGTIEWE